MRFLMTRMTAVTRSNGVGDASLLSAIGLLRCLGLAAKPAVEGCLSLNTQIVSAKKPVPACRGRIPACRGQNDTVSFRKDGAVTQVRPRTKSRRVG